MEAFQLDDLMEVEPVYSRGSRQKPAKRKWREIEALKERRELEKELRELDPTGNFKLDDYDI